MKLGSSLSYQVLIWTWLTYTTLLLLAYESNLRASLIKQEYHKAIDSVEELYNLGKSLHFPINSLQTYFFARSPLRHQQVLGRRALEEEQYFDCWANCADMAQQEAILNNGDGFIMTKNVFLAAFSVVLNRYGGENRIYLAKNAYGKFNNPLIAPKGAAGLEDISNVVMRYEREIIIDFCVITK